MSRWISASLLHFLCTTFITFQFICTAQAQQTPNAAPGIRSDAVYDFSGVEDISLFNGSLFLIIPIGLEYPVADGFSYQLSLRYSSSPWDSHSYSEPCAAGCPIEFQPKQTHNAGLGWRLALPELLPETNFWNQTQAWTYVGADGGEHVFYGKLHPSDTEDADDSDGFGGVQLIQYSRDGSYLRFKRTSEDATAATVELPSGHVHSFEKVGDDWRLTRMADLFGNGVDITYGTDDDGNVTWTLADAHRSHVITFTDPGAGFPHQRQLISKIELAAFNDQIATYSFSYATKTVNRPPAHNHPSLDRSINVQLLRQISQPSGTSYTIGTAAAPDYQDEGMITKLRLPTLGYLEWDWTTLNFPVFRTKPPSQSEDELVEPFNVVMAVAAKRQKNINDGTLGEWTYTRTLNREDTGDELELLPELLTVTVQRPLGDKSEHYFSVYPSREMIGWRASEWGTRWNEYSLPYTRSVSDPQGGDRYLSSKVFDCDSDGEECELVRSVYVQYDLDTDANFNDASGLLFNKNRRLVSQRTVDHYTDFSGEVATDHRLEVFSDFDGLGHHRQATISSNFGPTRTKTTNFNSVTGSYPASFVQISKDEPWLTGLYDSQSTTENGQTAKQEFCFDSDNGALLRTRVLKNDDGTRSDDDVVQDLTVDSQGQVTAQQWHGSDTGTVGTGDLCGLTLGNSTFRLDNTYEFGVLKTSRYTDPDGTISFPLGVYEIEHTSIDDNTGLVKSSKNPAGLSTEFTFDTSGRLTLISPSTASSAAATKIFYRNATSSASRAQVEVRELENGSVDNSDTLTLNRYLYDGLGRLYRERVRLPTALEQFSDRYYYFDNEGRQWGTSVWGSTDYATGSVDLDPFGRPSTIYPPDADATNTAHAIHLEYEGFRRTRQTVNIGTTFDSVTGEVKENAVSNVKEFDSFGRLVSLTEPSDDGDDVKTTYEYDVGDRLISASTPVGGVLSQTRTWTYDQRGFLASECHPEKGETGNGCTLYERYDPLGQARRVIDGPFTRLYHYDRATRLTAITEPTTGNETRLLKLFSYGSESTAENHALGQLVQTVNYQYPGEAFESRFIENFQYGGIGGARDYRQVEWQKECDDTDDKVDCQDDGFATEEVFEHSQTFDPTGKVASITYPICTDRDDGCGDQTTRTVGYTYHVPSGFLTAVTDTDAGGWIDNITYHANMATDEIHHANGLKDVWGLDPNFMSRPGSIHTDDAAENVLWQSGSFKFDGAGNLIELQTDGFTDRFRYDGVSRLVESDIWIGSSPTLFVDSFESGDISAWTATTDALKDTYSIQEYTFDIPGNLLSIETDDQVDSNPMVTVTNRLKGATYDGAGNLTQFTDSDGVQVSHVYDPFNRLIERTKNGVTTQYFYTADDERIMRFRDGKFTWSLRDLGGRLLREFSPETGGMVAQRDHIYRANRLAGTVTRDDDGSLSEKHHYSLDHLGSPRLISDATGNIESEHRYYPFGEEATSTSQNDHTLKFTGHERDFNAAGEGDDLDYMHARYCDPLRGRFLSVDPVLGTADEPQSWNRYAYVRGNPMVYIDPTGETPDTLVDLAFLAFDAIDIAHQLSTTGEVSQVTWAATMADLTMLFIPGGTGGGLGVRLADGTAQTGQMAAQAATRQSGRIVQAGTKGAQAGQAMQMSSTGPKGGTYTLLDPATGDVMRTGRSKDLNRRKGEHGRSKKTKHLRFKVDARTDSYDAQRGREQIIHDRHKPPLNKINPISPRNKNRERYLDAGRRIGTGG